MPFYLWQDMLECSTSDAIAPLSAFKHLSPYHPSFNTPQAKCDNWKRLPRFNAEEELSPPALMPWSVSPKEFWLTGTLRWSMTPRITTPEKSRRGGWLIAEVSRLRKWQTGLAPRALWKLSEAERKCRWSKLWAESSKFSKSPASLAQKEIVHLSMGGDQASPEGVEVRNTNLPNAGSVWSKLLASNKRKRHLRNLKKEVQKSQAGGRRFSSQASHDWCYIGGKLNLNRTSTARLKFSSPQLNDLPGSDVFTWQQRRVVW